MKDWSKVERFFAQTGIAEFDEDTCVSSKDFDSLLTELRETRRALENMATDTSFSNEHAMQIVEERLSDARTELQAEGSKQ